MSLDIQVLKDFLANHETHYVGKYRFHSGYRNEEYGFKNHYYMLDQNFRQIDIYVEIRCKDCVTYTFSEDLHEQEKLFIAKDAIKRIIDQLQYKSTLHYSLYEKCVKEISDEKYNADNEEYVLQPIDFCNILNYMKYHMGINQKTMDEFYGVFMPCLKAYLYHKNYKQFMDSVNLLLKHIVYQYEWDGTTSKYVDTEYQYHLYYIREIIRMIYERLDKFYLHVPNDLYEAIDILCSNTRFTFAIMTDFGNLVMSNPQVTKSIMSTLKGKLVLSDKNKEQENVNLVFSYIYYLYMNDYEQYHEVILKVFRNIINYMLTFANHDLDLALGNALIQSEGYQIILDLFHEDYNTFIFTCFPIDSFPLELRPKVREELTTAIQFFAARMDNDNYRLSSFEQVMNINRLLMDNFKGWCK